MNRTIIIVITIFVSLLFGLLYYKALKYVELSIEKILLMKMQQKEREE